MSTTSEAKISVEYLEQLLQMAAIDAEFSNELQTHPEVFGMNANIEVPKSVEKQDESFVELLSNALGQFEIVACLSTCSAGPLTIVCDGTTK